MIIIRITIYLVRFSNDKKCWNRGGGLDYHYGKDSKDEQKKSFITQINVARDTSLPLIIHARDDIDMMTILEDEFKKGSLKPFFIVLVLEEI